MSMMSDPNKAKHDKNAEYYEDDDYTWKEDPETGRCPGDEMMTQGWDD